MPPKKSATATQQANSSFEEQDDDNNVENEAIIKQMVCASVQYILIHSSKAQVIKRLDWTNTVLRPMAFVDGRKCFPTVLKQVTKILDQTFGYKLVEDEKHDGKRKTRRIFHTKFSIQGFILVNALPKGPLEQRPLANPSQYSKYALLMIIVACLKRAGGEMTSTDFWAILSETFSIRNDESTRLTINQHKIFGDVQKLIKIDFAKEGYLIFDQTKDLTGDTPAQTVKLGLRAQCEFPDHALDEFIEKVGGYGIESDNDDDAMEEDN
jgi:hypothetical protein